MRNNEQTYNSQMLSKFKQKKSARSSSRKESTVIIAEESMYEED